MSPLDELDVDRISDKVASGACSVLGEGHAYAERWTSHTSQVRIELSKLLLAYG